MSNYEKLDICKVHAFYMDMRQSVDSPLKMNWMISYFEYIGRDGNIQLLSIGHEIETKRKGKEIMFFGVLMHSIDSN